MDLTKNGRTIYLGTCLNDYECIELINEHKSGEISMVFVNAPGKRLKKIYFVVIKKVGM